MNPPRSSLPCRPVAYVTVLLVAVSGLLIAVRAAQPSSATASVALKRDESPRVSPAS